MSSTRSTRHRRPAPARVDQTGHSQIALFDLAALRHRVGLTDDEDEPQHFLRRPFASKIVSYAQESQDEGEAKRREWHKKMLIHPMGATRSLAVPTGAMIEQVSAIRPRAPHFSGVLDWIGRATGLAANTGTPLRLPPCLLIGEPGNGKTWFMRQLALALGLPSLSIAMNTLTDRGSTLTGLSPAWKAAGPGKIARQLVEGATASPLVLLDEIDKIAPLNPAETPIEALHSLLEVRMPKTLSTSSWMCLSTPVTSCGSHRPMIRAICLPRSSIGLSASGSISTELTDFRSRGNSLPRPMPVSAIASRWQCRT